MEEISVICVIFSNHTWKSDQCDNLHFHFWVDSEYAFNLLTDYSSANTHFFTVQDILQLACHLHSSFQHSFTIHRISSHIEQYSGNTCQIQGSIEAGSHAQHASTQKTSFTSNESIRLQIFERSARLLQQINGRLNPKKPKKPAGPSSDDFSAPATANQSSGSVLHPVRVPA